MKTPKKNPQKAFNFIIWRVTVPEWPGTRPFIFQNLVRFFSRTSVFEVNTKIMSSDLRVIGLPLLYQSELNIQIHLKFQFFEYNALVAI